MKNKFNFRTKKNLFVFILLYMILLTLAFSANTYSKYTTVITNISPLGVARWDVSVSSQSSNTITVTRGNTTLNMQSQTYVLNVTSMSDVAMYYSIVVSNVPSGVSIKLDNETIYSESSNRITIQNVGSFNFDAADSNSTHTHDLTFIASANTALVENRALTIDVIFIQGEI